ncbi:type-F conjugative transfer system secretin TraK [Serratia sp. S1B]|nr:type-F conjugative transfer system secretin TraK [Serratia sp. S1B]
MKIKNKVGFFLAGFIGISSFALANAINLPVVIPLPNGGQANVGLSNTDPNLFTVPGDRIVAMNSVNGGLTQQEKTESGGVIVSTMSKEPFTFIIETERGQNFSIRAVPRSGAGRTFQLVGELTRTSEAAKSWEQGQPYEKMLVSLNKALMENHVPDGFSVIPVTNEKLNVPYGLKSTAEKVWIGYNISVVKFTIINTGTSRISVNERDFWEPNTRSIMFSRPTDQIIGGGRTEIYITRSMEGESDGKH